MLKKLPPREREIVDLLYERGDLTVAEISEALPGQLSGSAIRTMLSRLEHKGFVRRTESSKGHLYRPAVPDSQARKTALKDLVRVFFHGSPAGAATALLGMSDRLDETELDELEALIAQARAAKREEGK
ncbi:BlaI/MecI/CopY family transcriptional regulator [Altererythrobacter sp. Root672]|uniref:BlaI/MecI/CopY family transcriptional regulator n=1 Tax=Altererythrobacter sp. Root672 TaxID=1736584 RepID=UPI0007015D97|nr:BlaI/MecI/CopY family transcriptional regulator [Altererythrobacter sp. Root672]KRA84313.1 transcriptional regulator [Altererythrobacter sp. Root672]